MLLCTCYSDNLTLNLLSDECIIVFQKKNAKSINNEEGEEGETEMFQNSITGNNIHLKSGMWWRNLHTANAETFFQNAGIATTAVQLIMSDQY